ncbi:MAG TPA: TlpA disulfide reductase family protein [Burkholderiaceae bacterium]|nr:TlpA disulfide reductase family protein [Burkholderiaceae bacterium]
MHIARIRMLRFTLALAAVLASAGAGATLVSQRAPDFTLPSAAGRNLRLQEQRGQVVMLNFWATWCGPCRREMPHLDRLYAKYHAAGFVLLGVNVDEDQRNAVGVMNKLGLHFPVLFDTKQKVSRLYDLSTMPSTVLIDRDGRVRYVHLGYREGFEDTYEKQITELLRE